jgi:hypothetical protein
MSMNSLRKPGFVILITGNVALVGLLWLILRRLPLPGADCIHPSVQSLLFALGILTALNLLTAFFIAKPYRWAAVILALLLILTWWLGSYPYSPVLGSADRESSVLAGFRIMRSGRANVTISPGDTVSLSGESIMSIEALVATGNARCTWQSSQGGALDGPDTCSPVYTPPQGADFDILKVHIVPGCQLPAMTRQIKISKLP